MRVLFLSHASLWIDESFSLWLGQHFSLASFRDVLATRDPLYHGILRAVLALAHVFHADPLLFARLLSAVAGTGMIVLIFFLGKKWYGTSVALLASLFMTFSTFDIAWSRQVRMYALWDVLFWLTLLMWTLFCEQRRKKHLLTAGILTIATIATHKFGVFLFPLFLLAWYLFALRPRRAPTARWRYDLVVIALYMAGVVLLLLLNDKATVYSDRYFLWLFLEHPLTLALTVLAFVQTLRKNANAKAIAVTYFLVGTIMVVLSVLAFAVPLLHYRYLLGVHPALFLLASSAVIQCWRMIQQTVINKIYFGIAIVAVTIFSFIHREFTLLPQRTFLLEQEPVISRARFRSYTPQPNFRKMMEIIANNQTPADIIITPYPTVTFWYLGQLDHFALPLSLTNPSPAPTTKESEYYTHVPFLTEEKFRELLASDAQGWILLDDLARTRLDPVLRKSITENAQLFTHEDAPPFSSLQLYHFE